MRPRASLLLFATVAMLGIGPVALAPEVAHAATKEAQRAEVRKADQTLERLYKLQPGARQAIQKAAGHALFSNFANSGWELSAQATTAAQLSGQGAWAAGAMPISPGVWLYQLTDHGLGLELTAKGTNYYQDDALN